MAQPRISISVNKDNLSCSVCLDFLRDPASIPCGHSFCLACIQELWNVEERLRRPCRCPSCGHSFPSRPAPVKNITLAELVRGTEEWFTSADDAGVEGRRRRPDGGAGPSKRSRILGASETQVLKACRKHNNREMEVYCREEDQCICTLCAAVDHRGHTIVLVSEERKKKQVELRNMKDKSKGMIVKTKENQEDLRKNMRHIEEGRQAMVEHCEGVFTTLVDSLQRHFSRVMELIGAQERTATGRAEGALGRLELCLAELKRRDGQLEKLSETKDDHHFLQNWSLLLPFAETSDLSFVTVDTQLPFESIRKAVEEIGSRLAEFCGKEVSNISQMVNGDRDDSLPLDHEVDSEQLQSESEILDTSCLVEEVLAATDATPSGPAACAPEPTTRAELLQYACELTLDPNTAHKDLHISHNGRTVIWDPKKPKDSASVAPPHPERFMRRRQVLCRQGLESERCYYEVEVDGDKAEVAMAYRGIDRGSLSRSSAFGGNVKSWSLDRSKTYSVSHDDVSVQLTATPNKCRIGVYLKFKEGSLSFYEVFGNRIKFLYTIEATFTEPVYPGFWLGDMCSISLPVCDLRHQ